MITSSKALLITLLVVVAGCVSSGHRDPFYVRDDVGILHGPYTGRDGEHLVTTGAIVHPSTAAVAFQARLRNTAWPSTYFVQASIQDVVACLQQVSISNRPPGSPSTPVTVLVDLRSRKAPGVVVREADPFAAAASGGFHATNPPTISLSACRYGFPNLLGLIHGLHDLLDYDGITVEIREEAIWITPKNPD